MASVISSTVELKEFLHELEAPPEGIFYFNIVRNNTKAKFFFTVSVGVTSYSTEFSCHFPFYNDGKFIESHKGRNYITLATFFETLLPTMKKINNNFLFSFAGLEIISNFLKCLSDETKALLNGLHFYGVPAEGLALKQKFKTMITFDLEGAAKYCRGLIENSSQTRSGQIGKKAPMIRENPNQVLFISDLHEIFTMLSKYESIKYGLIYSWYPKIYDQFKTVLYAFSRQECYLSNTPLVFAKLEDGNHYMQNLMKMFLLVPYGLIPKGANESSNPWRDFLLGYLHDPRLLLWIELFIRPLSLH